MITSNNLGLAYFALRSEEHTSELQSRPHLVCRLLLEKKKKMFEEHLECGIVDHNFDHRHALRGSLEDAFCQTFEKSRFVSDVFLPSARRENTVLSAGS